MNSLPPEIIAHVLSFLSPTDLTRFSLSSFQIYQENRLLLESYRALFSKRPAYLRHIKRSEVTKQTIDGTEVWQRPDGLTTSYKQALRQTIFLRALFELEFKKLSLPRGEVFFLQTGQTRIAYADSICLNKYNTRGELTLCSALYITDKSPKETYLEEQDTKIIKFNLIVIVVVICVLSLLILHDSHRI
jgi:hypothetical protein